MERMRLGGMNDLFEQGIKYSRGGVLDCSPDLRRAFHRGNSCRLFPGSANTVRQSPTSDFS